MQTQLTFNKPEFQPGMTIQQKFEAFHKLNPNVYAKLCELARQLKKKGHTSLGIGMLWEVIRWQYFMETADPNSGYHLNNIYRSRYARLIQSNEQDLKNIFETRKLTAA